MSATILPFRRPTPQPLPDTPEMFDLIEARENVAKLRGEVARGKRGSRLLEAFCAEGCSPCFRTCAVARIKLDWWARELSRLEQEGGRG